MLKQILVKQKMSYFMPGLMPKIPFSETPKQKLYQELAKPSQRNRVAELMNTRKWATSDVIEVFLSANQKQGP